MHLKQRQIEIHLCKQCIRVPYCAIFHFSLFFNRITYVGNIVTTDCSLWGGNGIFLLLSFVILVYSELIFSFCCLFFIWVFMPWCKHSFVVTNLVTTNNLIMSKLPILRYKRAFGVFYVDLHSYTVHFQINFLRMAHPKNFKSFSIFIRPTSLRETFEHIFRAWRCVCACVIYLANNLFHTNQTHTPSQNEMKWNEMRDELCWCFSFPYIHL